MKPQQKFRISLNLHACINSNPLMFKTLARLLLENGHEVHIIYGPTKKKERAMIEHFGIPFSHLFSLTDYHIKAGTPMTFDSIGNPRMAPYLWDKVPGEYCSGKKIDLHFDDSGTYDRFFKTPYVCVYPTGSQGIRKVGLSRILEAIKNPDREYKIRLGLDLHGVIDTRPEFFKMLTELLVENGHEVHILTGSVKERELPMLTTLGIRFTHFFSITDYHKRIGTEIFWDERGNPHLDIHLWDETKSEYCRKKGIDLHLDDSDVYHYFFTSPYGRFYGRDSHRIRKMHIDDALKKKY